MEIIISQENPYKSYFDQLDDYNRCKLYNDIMISLSYNWEAKEPYFDKYDLMFKRHGKRLAYYVNYVDAYEGGKAILFLETLGWHQNYEQSV